MEYKELVKTAIKAREKAYVPYSKFKVGAAVITEDGSVYEGCNIENASYGATNCAERTAIFKAVSEGHREIKVIAVVGDMSTFTTPCGICRQVIAEFASKDLKIIIIKNEDEYVVKNLEDILPGAFTKEDLLK
ncbi:cytidine deaminase [Clostridium argentinense CDC 2741]|uniref:Cytidine deaminase n=1 Tax=Clostridium argentinense CDC 2741 TaxID=1418104 RepID=A0A0C1R0X5_9CLOT|nr:MULTISPECIES: cytidine deaminase [Clostridium]ARC85523.1 cytidine deaminase [Clostridium argentinense]KIE47012.1 cytidine deaminase [Clostridium argentinense CDC 2741]NFF40036.1 cytidine deaminase [Clostridium argentinense]NFP50264.1 cytidine deaminase [Clostridium argentinense]NFP71905.1 cytidine deaminase [Clostridium argentinense]